MSIYGEAPPATAGRPAVSAPPPTPQRATLDPLAKMAEQFGIPTAEAQEKADAEAREWRMAMLRAAEAQVAALAQLAVTLDGLSDKLDAALAKLDRLPTWPLSRPKSSTG